MQCGRVVVLVPLSALYATTAFAQQQPPTVAQVEKFAAFDGPLIYEMKASPTGGSPTFQIATTFKVNVEYFVVYDWRADPPVPGSTLAEFTRARTYTPGPNGEPLLNTQVGSAYTVGTFPQTAGVEEKRLVSRVKFSGTGTYKLELKRDRIPEYKTDQPTPPPNSVIKKYNLAATTAPHQVINFTVVP